MPDYFNVPRVLERAFTRLGLRSRQYKFSGTNKHAYKLYDTVTQLPVGILIELPFFGSDRTKMITLKPVDSNNVFDFFYKIITLFGRSILDAEVVRFDYCVDYHIPFIEVIKGIKVKFKRKGDRYSTDRGQRTGVNFGKPPEMVVVYDKSEEMKANDGVHRTRVEIQLYRDKLPIKSLREISNCYRVDGEVVRPYRNVELQKIDFVSEDAFISNPVKYRKLIELRTLTEESGFNIAKQRYNRHGNFIRDYGRDGFYTISELDVHPDIRLERSQRAFFSGWEDAFVSKTADELFEMSKLREDSEVGNFNSPTWGAEQNHVKELPSEL